MTTKLIKPKWRYNKRIKLWQISDKFGSFGYTDKPNFPIITGNILLPVHCEITNKQIGWRNSIPVNYKGFCFPAFFSFKAIDKNGKIAKIRGTYKGTLM
jgi:hypothetical protein